MTRTACANPVRCLSVLRRTGWETRGYVGNRMITPNKKPIYRELVDWEKDCNTQVNKIRCVIERVIANVTTWRIVHTDYRRPLSTFTTTISAVVGLHFYLAS